MKPQPSTKARKQRPHRYRTHRQIPKVTAPRNGRKTPPKIEWLRYEQLELVFPTWLIDEIIPERSTALLYGRRGGGKTFLALDFALSIAFGEPWNEFPVKKTGVVYMLAENPDGLRRRIDGWLLKHGVNPEHGKGYFERNEAEFHVAKAGHALNVKAELNEVRRALEERPGTGLVVLDPLISFFEGSENDARQMQKFIDGLREIVKNFKCTVLTVHHEGKGKVTNAGEEIFNAFGARGSSALEAGMDSVLYLSPMQGERVATLKTTKQRETERLPDMQLRFNDVEATDKIKRGIFPEFQGYTGGTKKSMGVKNRETWIICLLRKQKNGIRIEEIIQHATNEGINIGSESTVWKSLNKLESINKIEIKKLSGANVYSIAPKSLTRNSGLDEEAVEWPHPL